jgi:hypothetical protein
MPDDITMHSVTSSNVKAIGHDGKDLIVAFLNGRSYRYIDVPDNLLMDGLGAPSVGKWLNLAIKPRYQAEAI